jgi:uncharacterized protein (TIGR02996 family)
MHFTDEQPFLDAIFERYTDDRPRLVYADFLDDAGEPERAELIRVQLALARLDEDDPRRTQLNDRKVELLAHNRAAWMAPLAGLVETVDFRGGIPDSVTVDAASFLERGEELFRKLRVRRVRLLDAAPVIAKLFRSPLLAGIRELDLCNADLGNAGLALLAQSPFLKDLESLDLGFNSVEDAGVTALSRGTGLLNLTSLALNDNDSITGDGLRSLAESPFFAGLTSLDVSGNDIGETGVSAVVNSSSMSRLRTFRMNGNPVGDAGIASLTNSPLLARMLKADPRLELRGNSAGAKGASAIASCRAVAACTSLDLTNNYLRDEGAAALLGSPHLASLKVLRLARNQITDAGISAARSLFDALFDRVQLLDVSGNRLTRYGLNLLDSIRGQRAVQIDKADNVQSATASDAPVSVSDIMPDVMEGVAEAARLRHRIAHPGPQND